MFDLEKIRYWMMFTALSLLILMIQILPVRYQSGWFTGPDLLLVFTYAWALRRPGRLPVILVGSILLIADLLLQRPPGLWAFVVVLGSQILGRISRDWRDAPYWHQWILVSVMIAATALIYRTFLFVTLLPLPPLHLVIIQTITSILIYPAVVFILVNLMGVDFRRRDYTHELE